MDLASGYALTGSVENALLVTAGAQLAKEKYQMPVNMHGPYTDSIIPDCQAGIENTYFSLLPALAEADILTGAGHLQGGGALNLDAFSHTRESLLDAAEDWRCPIEPRRGYDSVEKFGGLRELEHKALHERVLRLHLPAYS